MTTGYHINPNTGKISRCRARIKCKFNFTEEQHFDSKEDAQKYSEIQFEKEHGLIPNRETNSSLKRIKNTNQSLPHSHPENRGTYDVTSSGSRAMFESFSLDRFSSLEGVLTDNENNRFVEIGSDRRYFGDLTDDHALPALARSDAKGVFYATKSEALAIHLYATRDEVVTMAEVYDRKGAILQTLVKLEDGSYVNSMGVWSRKRLEEYFSLNHQDASVKDLTIEKPQDKIDSKIEGLALTRYLNTMIRKQKNHNKIMLKEDYLKANS